MKTKSLDDTPIYYEDVPIKGSRPVKRIGKYGDGKRTRTHSVATTKESNHVASVIGERLLIIKIATLSLVKDILK